MPKTVALLNDSLLDVGGVESHLLALIRGASSRQYRWLVLAPTTDAFANEAARCGADVIAWSSRRAWDVPALARLVKILRDSGVELVHAHNPRAGLLGRLAARWLHVPVVVTVHMPSYRYGARHALLAHLKSLLYRHVESVLISVFTDRLIYVSQTVYEEALRFGLAPHDRTTVIENGIDLSRLECVPERSRDWNRDHLRPVLCYVGRLEHLKGVDVLLRAAALLRESGQQFELRLVGDGPQRSELEQQVHDLGLRELVRVLGFRSDLPEMLSEADVFVLPSRHEAMSIALLEAMAAGLPVVATDVGDNARVVEHGVTGLIVPPEDPVALAKAVRRIIHDADERRRMGVEARHRAKRYGVQTMVDRTLAVYASLLH
ncbi:MAG: glycosyltransferase family 4 protein [Anaerolineae bacterium]